MKDLKSLENLTNLEGGKNMENLFAYTAVNSSYSEEQVLFMVKEVEELLL